MRGLLAGRSEVNLDTRLLTPWNRSTVQSSMHKYAAAYSIYQNLRCWQYIADSLQENVTKMIGAEIGSST